MKLSGISEMHSRKLTESGSIPKSWCLEFGSFASDEIFPNFISGWVEIHSSQVPTVGGSRPKVKSGKVEIYSVNDRLEVR